MSRLPNFAGTKFSAFVASWCRSAGGTSALFAHFFGLMTRRRDSRNFFLLRVINLRSTSVNLSLSESLSFSDRQTGVNQTLHAHVHVLINYVHVHVVR